MAKQSRLAKAAKPLRDIHDAALLTASDAAMKAEPVRLVDPCPCQVCTIRRLD